MKNASRYDKFWSIINLLPHISIRQLNFLLKWVKNERLHIHNGQMRINSFLPPNPSLAYDRFFKAVLCKKRIPLNIYLAATAKCACKCPHCSYGKRSKDELSNKQMINLIDQIKDLGTPTLGFTGGEPLLRKDLEELLNKAYPELNTIIFTTGHNLTRQKAKNLKKSNVGCVTVGIESANPKKHDEIRNFQGSFEWCKKSVKNCVDEEIYTALSTIGFRDKIRSGDLEKIYQLGKEWGVGEIRLLNPVATGGYINNSDEILTDEEIGYLINFHKSHNRLRDGPIIESFAYIESSELFGCGAGFHHLFIDAKGNVCPCDLTPLSFGNVLDKSLVEIWDEMGNYFPRPRNNCFMNSIVGKIPKDKSFPISPDRSIKLVEPVNQDVDLPGWYKVIMR